MNIAIGTKNPVKIQAVKSAFEQAQLDADFTSYDVPSEVSAQPISDEETRLGAVNRARHAQLKDHAEVGIGLEGGVKWIEGTLYLCNWGALVTAEDTTFTAMGAGLPLPEEIAKGIEAGSELGPLMDHFTSRTGIRHAEGAIGVFTNNLITRQSMFEHIVLQLVGQYTLHKSVN